MSGSVSPQTAVPSLRALPAAATRAAWTPAGNGARSGYRHCRGKRLTSRKRVVRPPVGAQFRNVEPRHFPAGVRRP
ncbi:ORFS334W [Human betaherpesvirus 5]|nr:ORFS334W [Human betaherpesvirus 5]QHX40693.1 ORFS334W [Human betaherpesvirus 5]